MNIIKRILAMDPSILAIILFAVAAIDLIAVIASGHMGWVEAANKLIAFAQPAVAAAIGSLLYLAISGMRSNAEEA